MAMNYHKHSIDNVIKVILLGLVSNSVDLLSKSINDANRYFK